MITMADDIYVANLPPGYGAYAGYVGGSWPTYSSGQLGHRFPSSPLLSIAISASLDAACLDIESGDATASQAPSWVLRQIARGEHRPVVYSSISNMPNVLNALASAHISRSEVRLWSAHYEGQHICGPYSCKYQGAATPSCDGTQWTNTQPGLNGSQIDASILVPGFFAPPMGVNTEPTGLSATPYATSVNFGWNAATTAHAGTSTYHFQLLNSTGAAVSDQRITATHTSVMGLPSNTTFQWRVATGMDAWNLASQWTPLQPVTTK